MTYSAGGLIQATDYNGFASTTVGANVNDIWGVGASDKGYGQSTTLATVSAAATVTATQWASLNTRIASMANHQGTTITARTNPVVGDTIAILTALNTDLTSVNNNRGNAVASGSQFTGWSGTSSQTAGTGSGNTAWTLTFTHTITWASANAARYFFNAGGRIKWETSKTSTGTDADEEWNDQANTLNGDIYITGGTGSQTIAGTAYTGTTKIGGSGSPSVLATAIGWYDLTTSDTEIYKQFADTYGYTSNYVNIDAKTAGSGTQLVLTTRWVSPGDALFPNNNISGGTATTGITFGTGPATVVTYFPPSATYLTEASWGTPTVVASVAAS
jgi:hypothetical protein